MTSKPDSMETRLADDTRPADEPPRPTETRSPTDDQLEERQRAEYLRLLRLV